MTPTYLGLGHVPTKGGERRSIPVFQNSKNHRRRPTPTLLLSTARALPASGACHPACNMPPSMLRTEATPRVFWGGCCLAQCVDGWRCLPRIVAKTRTGKEWSSTEYIPGRLVEKKNKITTAAGHTTLAANRGENTHWKTMLVHRVSPRASWGR